MWMSKTFVAVAVAALTLLAAPAAHAKGAAANLEACVPRPALEHPFAPWLDNGFYDLHPGGDMESGLPGWALSGGAALVAGDDGLGVRAGATVLSLPAGATAVTSPICIDDTFTHARLLARTTIPSLSKLTVDVLYTDTNGKTVEKGSKTFSTKSFAWAPSENFDIDAKLQGAAPVQFRFTAPNNSNWLLDDFYVDPRMRG
jgi:hypothetical protein